MFLYRPTSAPACLESLCSGLRQKISFHKRSTYDKMIKESLQSVIVEQEKEIEKRKEQETLLRQEIADFVGYVSFFDF